MSDTTSCTHGGGLSCVQCRFGVDDIVEAWVLFVRDNLDDDPLAADIAEALVRETGDIHLDSLSPEEAARIAAKSARDSSSTTEREEP